MLSLFDRIIVESKLAPGFAKGVIARACDRAGVDEPERIRRHQLAAALPNIEAALSTYLTHDEAKRRTKAIGQLIRSTSSGGWVFDLNDPELDEEE